MALKKKPTCRVTIHFILFIVFNIYIFVYITEYYETRRDERRRSSPGSANEESVRRRIAVCSCTRSHCLFVGVSTTTTAAVETYIYLLFFVVVNSYNNYIILCMKIILSWSDEAFCLPFPISHRRKKNVLRSGAEGRRPRLFFSLRKNRTNRVDGAAAPGHRLPISTQCCFGVVVYAFFSVHCVPPVVVWRAGTLFLFYVFAVVFVLILLLLFQFF